MSLLELPLGDLISTHRATTGETIHFYLSPKMQLQILIESLQGLSILPNELQAKYSKGRIG